MIKYIIIGFVISATIITSLQLPTIYLFISKFYHYIRESTPNSIIGKIARRFKC